VTAHAAQRVAEAEPSFDCGKAASRVEQEICGEYASNLRAADRTIAALYKRAKAKDAGVKTSQRAWLKQRNLCGVAEYPADCIRESYSTRKEQLLGLLGGQHWLARGEAALFVDDVLPLPAAMAGSGLFAKIAPALVGASMTGFMRSRVVRWAPMHICAAFTPRISISTRHRAGMYLCRKGRQTRSSGFSTTGWKYLQGAIRIMKNIRKLRMS
jgi:uncharacterized protein YecT (DUF1311 family)